MLFKQQHREEQALRAGIIGAAIGSAIGATTVLLLDKQNRGAFKTKVADGFERVGDTVAEKAQALRARTQMFLSRPHEEGSQSTIRRQGNGGRTTKNKTRNGVANG